MTNTGAAIRDLRLVFTLVPWRMRPRLIAITLGSTAIAFLDLAAVLLMLPVMELAMGTQIDDSGALQRVERWTGIHSEQRMLVATLLLAVAMMSAKSALALLFKWWSSGVMTRAQSDVLHQLTVMYTSAPWIHHRKRSTADIFQAVNFYVPGVFTQILAVGMGLVVDAVSVFALMLGLIAVSPVATLVAVLFFGGSAWIIQQTMKNRLLVLAEQAREHDVQAWRYFNPSIDGLKEIRLAGANEDFAKRFSDERRASAFLNRTRIFLLEVPKASLEIIMLLGVLLVAVILMATMPQTQAFAFLGVFALAATRTIPSLNRMVANIGTVRSGLPTLRALGEILRELRTQECEDGRLELATSDHHFEPGDIHFENLTFQFPDANEPVLDEVSGTLKQGQTTALVGGSGAGKTTFVELLLTLFTPSSGSITTGNVSIHDHPSAWRKQLGVVVQDVFLLDASIKDNITLGIDSQDIDEQRLERAVQQSQLEQVIAEAPNGIDTLVGSRGARLSGGQRQRVGIARALYRDPQILVLDEATSALDNETEAKITETIKALQGQMTIVIVAHRLSTVKHADQILFFSQGKIAGRGTMDELAASNEEFARLVELGNLK